MRTHSRKGTYENAASAHIDSVTPHAWRLACVQRSPQPETRSFEMIEKTGTCAAHEAGVERDFEDEN